MKNNYFKIATLILLIFVLQIAKAQQDPNHPDNTYLSTEQVDVWTTAAAAQADFDTPAERQNFIFREALVQNNAFMGGHKDLAHWMPHQHSTEITTLINESGNLDDDIGLYKSKVADGTMSSLSGALHILRVATSNITGTSWPVDLNDRRFNALNMDYVNFNIKAHEFAHTFNDALRAGYHNNALSSVPADFFYLDGTSAGSANRPTIGYPTAALQVEFYTSSEGNSIGNPTYGGDGYVYYDYYNSSTGVLIGYGRVNLADLDFDQRALADPDINDPNPGVNDNVSDRIVEAVNSGDPGYAPKVNTVLAADEAPQPTFIIDAGKYKLTDGAEDDDLGFDFDAFGNRFPAIIRYYPYNATNDVNDANLDLPPGYGSHGVTRAEAEAGIDKAFYDANYPDVDIVWKRYSFKPDALGESSEVIAIPDTDPPVLDNPSLPTVTAQCSIEFPASPPTATDAVDGVIVGTTTTTFPITAQGLTVVTWNFADSSGNTVSQTQNFEIDDTLAPTPDVATLPTLTDQCEVPAPASNPTATDNCGGVIIGTTSTSFPITLSTTIVWEYDDGNGNIFTQNQEVVINDTEAPSNTTNLTAETIGDHDVTLTWDASVDNCDGVIFYDVYQDESFLETITATNLFVDGLTAGTSYTFKVIAKDSNNNQQAGAEITINTSVGIADFEIKGFTIYPNPADETVYIKADQKIEQVFISDILGHIVLDTFCKTSLHAKTIAISRLPKGIYVIHVFGENGAQSSGKLIVE